MTDKLSSPSSREVELIKTITKLVVLLNNLDLFPDQRSLVDVTLKELGLRKGIKG